MSPSSRTSQSSLSAATRPPERTPSTSLAVRAAAARTHTSAASLGPAASSLGPPRPSAATCPPFCCAPTASAPPRPLPLRPDRFRSASLRLAPPLAISLSRSLARSLPLSLSRRPRACPASTRALAPTVYGLLLLLSCLIEVGGIDGSGLCGGLSQWLFDECDRPKPAECSA